MYIHVKIFVQMDKWEVVSPTHEHPQTDLQSDKPIFASIS